ncbi:MAG: hypothetical protein AB7W59_01470 [Acidimicrobiia bacterium]
MGSFLVRSLVLSIAATVVLNVVIRLLARPGGGLRRARPRSPQWPTDRRAPGGFDGDGDGDGGDIGHGHGPDAGSGPRVRVIFPWKLMLVGSLLLTVLVNVLTRLR